MELTNCKLVHFHVGLTRPGRSTSYNSLDGEHLHVQIKGIIITKAQDGLINTTPSCVFF